MTARATSCAVVLVLLGAGCGVAESPQATVEPATTPSDETSAPETPDTDPHPLLTLDAEPGQPVRGRLRSYDSWTYVEACVREVVAATPEQAARVRYTVRLCAEDGRTEAVALGWSKDEGRTTLFTDSIYETTVGETTGLYFTCPYGTAWEVDVTAESADDDRARLAFRGVFQVCTK